MKHLFLILITLFGSLHAQSKNDNIINPQILHLQQEIDSLKKAMDDYKLSYQLKDQQEVITRVNSFYESAWNKLTLIIVILGGAVPILLQFLSGWQQRKSLNELTNKISTQLSEAFDTKIASLEENNKSRMDTIEQSINDKANEMDKQMVSAIHMQVALSYFIRGIQLLEVNNYSGAFYHFGLSLDRTLRGKIWNDVINNIPSILKTLKELQPQEYKEQVLELNKWTSKPFNDFINDLAQTPVFESIKGDYIAILHEINRLESH